MIPSPRCLAPGFLKRSLDEFKRVSTIAVKLEGLTTPGRPFPLVFFDKPESLSDCKPMSDKDIGGFSTIHFDHHPATSKEPAHSRFHGEISTKLPVDRPQIQRTGYAAWRTLDRPFTIFGRSLWDIDPFEYLAVQFKSDGRKYFINVQTESIVPTDIHQHRLYAKSPGEWETVLIKWSEFVRTNHGQVVEPQREMLTQKVRTIGIGLIDRQPGPYDLSISRMWATNAYDADDILKEALRTSKGPLEGARTAEPKKPPKKEEAEKILI